MPKYTKAFRELGKKRLTRTIGYRLSLSLYENGCYIKPISKQGTSKFPKQDGIFLTRENLNYLMKWVAWDLENEKAMDNLQRENQKENQNQCQSY